MPRRLPFPFSSPQSTAPEADPPRIDRRTPQGEGRPGSRGPRPGRVPIRRARGHHASPSRGFEVPPCPRRRTSAPNRI
ncbi:hypothetical protein ADK41_21130 [Streptomyces caelestis]|uniref:Uncharacterized protein n=1 Tax=Streptomyces caelestis TaxID=36816 RepID=A0A0M9X842_9ACTN|nr:hypothetical protein ADK41_21130 [Streptomyces caelestis]KOV23047.1 hypothetical protein ADK58_26020 [Streptomyces sp. XY152]